MHVNLANHYTDVGHQLREIAFFESLLDDYDDDEEEDDFHDEDGDDDDDFAIPFQASQSSTLEKCLAPFGSPSFWLYSQWIRGASFVGIGQECH